MELGTPAFQPLSQAEMKTHGSSSAIFGASSNDSGPASATACALPASQWKVMLAPEDGSTTVGPQWLQGQKSLSMGFASAS